MKAAIYIRVSTDDQATEGYSIEAQKRNLTKYAIDNNLDIHDYYVDDGYSAKDLNRPKLQEMMKDVESKKIDTVCVWALDRLTRDVVDMWTLLNTFSKYGVKFLSMSDSTSTSTASGRLELNVKGIFAQYERERIGERVVEGMLQRAKEGFYTSRRVLGYDYNPITKQYTINPDEAKIVKLIFELHNKGWGIVRIANHLNKLGYHSKDGNMFANNSISYMINHGWYYCGKFMYRPKNKEPILLDAKNIEPILSYEEYLTVRSIKKANYSEAKKYGSEEFTFKRRLKCTCGATYKTYSTYTHRKFGKVLLRYYHCIRAHEGRCENKKSKRNDIIEQEFKEFLWNFANEDFSLSIERNIEKITEFEKNISTEQSNLEKELNRKKKLQYLLLDEVIDQDEYNELSEDITKSIDSLSVSIRNFEKEIADIKRLSTIEKQKELAKSLANIWDNLSQPEKRELVHRYIKKIVYSDQIERVEFII